MDKISDFFKELKDRLSSPFISSFIISWIIINWKISIGLLFYNNADLKLDGYISYFDLIAKNSNPANHFYKPLCIAFAYTFIYPIFRNIINAFQAWIKRWGNEWNMNISKTGKISMSKYIELRETYAKRTNLLEEVLAKESEFLNQNERLKNELLSSKNSINTLTDSLQTWRNKNNIGLLNGQWQYSILYGTSNKDVFKISIQSGDITFYDATITTSDRAKIINFYYQAEYNRIYFTISTRIPAGVAKDTEKRVHFSLDVLDEMRVLRGHDDTGTNVEFIRMP